MSIKLDINKLHIPQLLKLISSNISLYEYLNLIGDNAISRGATELRVYAEDNQDYQIHFIDNGSKYSDFVCSEEIFLDELSQKAPLIYNSSAFSNFIELSYYKNKEVNESIAIDLLSENKNQIEVISQNVKLDYLIKMSESEGMALNCLSIKNVIKDPNLEPRDNFYQFIKKINDNFTFRYHKLINEKKIKIIFLPEKKPLNGYNPLFENSQFKTQNQPVHTSGKYKCTITPHILSKSVTKEDIQLSCPSRSLEGSAGIYFYNAEKILLNKPSFFNLEQQLDIPITKKDNLLKYIKIEINFNDLNHSSEDLCRIFLKDKNNKNLIKRLIESASKEVDRVLIEDFEEKNEHQKLLEAIFSKKIQEFKSHDLSPDECYEELIKIYPNENYKKIIKEMIINV